MKPLNLIGVFLLFLEESNIKSTFSFAEQLKK